MRKAMVNSTTVRVFENVPGTFRETRTVDTFERPKDKENLIIALEEMGVTKVYRAKDGVL